MTYYLNEDLTFTPEEAARVKMIGNYGIGSTTQKRLSTMSSTDKDIA